MGEQNQSDRRGRGQVDQLNYISRNTSAKLACMMMDIYCVVWAGQVISTRRNEPGSGPHPRARWLGCRAQT